MAAELGRSARQDDDRILCATGRPLMPPIISACGRIVDFRLEPTGDIREMKEAAN
jgi:hypothetical protein